MSARPKNSNLHAARRSKNDEFYTQWVDIEREMNAYLEYDPNVFRDKTILLPCDDPEWSNFTKFFALHFTDYGIKKLISTSYIPGGRGKVFTLENEDINDDGVVNINDIRTEYLNGDGDFRSEELLKLRDEADIVITNPPFSLFREFIAWVMEGGVEFSVIGNMNAITYKEIFPLIKNNLVWKGATGNTTSMTFRIPGDEYRKLGNVCWLTNIEHGRRYEKLQLMTMADNVNFSRHSKIRERGYPEYDNYSAIEVSYTDAIPSDYVGIMEVPISFLDKYNPEQFDILGSQRWAKDEELLDVYRGTCDPPESDMKTLINGKETYDRIFIIHQNPK